TPAKGQSHHFRTQAGSAHSEQQCVLESCPGDFRRELLQALALGELLPGDPEPPQPLGFVGAGPDRSVARPDPCDPIAAFPGAQVFLRRPKQVRRKRIGERIHFGWVTASSLVKASSNCLTPAVTRSPVTVSIEIP